MKDDDSYLAHETSDELREVCGPCISKFKRFTECNTFCIDCNDYLCEDCRDAHYALHGATRQIDSNKKTKAFECSKHRQLNLDDFCFDHFDMICKECLDETHHACHVKPVTKVSLISSKESRIFQDKLKKFQTFIGVIKQQKMKDIKSQRFSHLKALTAEYRNAVSALTLDFKKRQEELKKCFKEQTDTLRNVLDDTDPDLQQLEEAMAKIETEQKTKAYSLFTEALPDVLLRIHLKYQKIIEPVKTIRDSYCLTSPVPYNCSRCVEKNDKDCYPKPEESFKTSDFVTASDRCDYTMLTDKYNRDGDLKRKKSVFETQLRSLGSLLIKTESDKNECCITGMCTSVDGYILMVDCYNKSIKLFSKSNKYLDSCLVPGEPFDITVAYNNEVAVTFWDNQKRIQLLNIRDDSLQLQNTIRLKNRVYGIAAVEDQIAITCDDYIPSVKLLSKDGQVHWSVSFDTDGNRLFKMPGYIIHGIIQSLSCLIVSDKEKHVITVIEAKTGEVLNFISFGNGGPHGLTFDSSGNVLVGFSYGISICLYSPDFTDFKELLTSEDSIRRPQAIVFNPYTNELVYSSWKSNVLERFAIL